MAALLTGNIVAADGTTIQGITLSSAELTNLRNIYNSAISSGQSSSQAFSTASSQVYTPSGNTLADALQLAQTALNLHGGPANANVSDNVTQMAQSTVSSGALSNIINGGTSTSSALHYTSSTPATTSNTGLYVVGGGLLVLMAILLFASEPSEKLSKYHPNQQKFQE